jgi:predicted porin
MKKSLFAVAAVTAFAGAAQAQSSVTVYGILDVGYIGSNATLNGNVAGAANGTSGGITKKQNSQFGASAEQTSRLGFKGTEDLGGGMQAIFTIEMGLNPQLGNLSGSSSIAVEQFNRTTNSTGSAIDNRQTFAGLHKNGIGQFTFGRQYTTVFNAEAATDAGQNNNVLGDVIYVPSGVPLGLNSGNGPNTSFTNRADNMAAVQSDSFGGFRVGGMYALNNNNSTTNSGTTSGGNVNFNGWGLNADFTWQKLFLTVAYQSFKTAYTNAVYASQVQTNTNGAGPSAGQLTSTGLLWGATQTSDKQTYVAGTYDFGILKAYLQWVGRKVQDDVGQTAATTGQQMNRTAQQIGVRSFITPTIEAWGSIGNGKYTGPISGGQLPGSVSFVGYQLGANYLLSKRTNLYAIYGQNQTSSSSSGVPGAGSSSNQYAIGMRHTF